LVEYWIHNGMAPI